ncbi:hypothetical protein [Novosphingobium sp.]|uniref:hypothetical protein n=1 Tax=Novosphingobium sp. TaxID=1874826 RepID=UPI0035B37349
MSNTKTAPAKAWTRPELRRLGTIADVANTTSAACQVQANPNCNGANSVLS